MKIEEATRHYPIYSRWKTNRGGDLLLVARHADIDTEEATAMQVLDLKSQELHRIEFEKWHQKVTEGSYSRVFPQTT